MTRLCYLCRLSATLLGCTAGEPRWVWSHPRLGEEALQQDLQDCRRSAAGEVSGPFLSPVVGSEFFAERDEALQRCMESRGWRLIEAPPGARAPYPRSLRGY